MLFRSEFDPAPPVAPTDAAGRCSVSRTSSDSTRTSEAADVPSAASSVGLSSIWTVGAARAITGSDWSVADASTVGGAGAGFFAGREGPAPDAGLFLVANCRISASVGLILGGVPAIPTRALKAGPKADQKPNKKRSRGIGRYLFGGPYSGQHHRELVR